LSTVYGPVPSWRLGRSLGVDVVLPPKKCTFDCIYCQLGKTGIQVSKLEETRGKLVDAERVARDLDKVLERLDIETVDVVTFSGTGEPTLNLELGKIAKTVRERIGDIPLVILTNSSLFHKKYVRENLDFFDLVVAKLDAGDNATFQAINRPADSMLTISKIFDSIKMLKQTINGKIALEVMLLDSANNQITNVQGKSLKNLVNKIVQVNPDQVQLEVPYRPPSESFVKIPSLEEVKLLTRELAKYFNKSQLQVYGYQEEYGKDVKWLFHESLEKEAVELLERRPSNTTDISRSLAISIPSAIKLLKRLVKNGLVTVEAREGKKYYFIRKKPSHQCIQ